jgi:hypothetical protein
VPEVAACGNRCVPVKYSRRLDNSSFRGDTNGSAQGAVR